MKKNILSNLFDWSVARVSGPVPLYTTRPSTGGRVLLGYTVYVSYNHHGVREYFFANDRKFGELTSEMARKQAEFFINKKKLAIKQR